MKIFLLVTIFLISFFNCSACENVKIEIVRQRNVEGLSENPFINHEVEIRITNTSKCKIFLKGSLGQDFFPIGFFATFNPKTKLWDSSFGSNLIPEFKDLGVSEQDNFEMIPNETFVFTDLLESAWTKKRYKRILYISFENKNLAPKKIESPIIIYKGKNL